MIYFFKGPCLNEDLVANGFCDDISNTPSCNYDGGDCCGFDVITDYCYNCECVIDEFGIGNYAEEEWNENENNQVFVLNGKK